MYVIVYIISWAFFLYTWFHTNSRVKTLFSLEIHSCQFWLAIKYRFGIRLSSKLKNLSPFIRIHLWEVDLLKFMIRIVQDLSLDIERLQSVSDFSPMLAKTVRRTKVCLKICLHRRNWTKLAIYWISLGRRISTPFTEREWSKFVLRFKTFSLPPILYTEHERKSPQSQNSFEMTKKIEPKLIWRKLQHSKQRDKNEKIHQIKPIHFYCDVRCVLLKIIAFVCVRLCSFVYVYPFFLTLTHTYAICPPNGSDIHILYLCEHYSLQSTHRGPFWYQFPGRIESHIVWAIWYRWDTINIFYQWFHLDLKIDSNRSQTFTFC